MKRIIVSVIVACVSVTMAVAQNQPKFSPEKFQADMEEFMTKEAGLTTEEAAKFFPLYREMQEKQRAVYKQMRELGKVKPADEASCKKAVQKRDELELEQKRICQTYHNKFFSVLSASKVYDVIRAESRFHRQAIKSWRDSRRQSKH